MKYVIVLGDGMCYHTGGKRLPRDGGIEYEYEKDEDCLHAGSGERQ